MKTCLNCGQALPDDASFCVKCGALVPEPSAAPAAQVRFCPTCGARLEASDKFCPGCGNPTGQRSAPAPTPPPAKKGRFRGLAVGAAVVALIAAAAVFLLPNVLSSPAKQFVRVQADFLSARMAPAQKALEIYGSGKLSTDVTFSASVDNAEINQYLQNSAVKLRMDLNGSRFLADGELSLMGTSVLTGALTYEAGQLGFCLPQADNTYYVMDLASVVYAMTGEEIDFESLSAPTVSIEDCKELLETYGGIFSGVVTEDNVLESKNQIVPFSQLGGSFQGTVYTFRPRNRDFQDAFVQLANQLERDQTLRRVLLEVMKGAQLEGYSEQELTQEIDSMLREAASELRDLAREAASSTENIDFAWTVGVEGKQLRKIEISVEGESILGYEMKGDEATGCEEIFYASSYGEVASIRNQYTRQGARVNGRSEISAGYSGSVTLRYDVDTSKASVLGLYCGTYDFGDLFGQITGGDLSCRLEVREGAGGGMDHVLTLQGDEYYFDYMFSKLELTVNTTAQSSVKAPSANKVDITYYSYNELEALFEGLGESLAADLQEIAYELSLYAY